ncbi:MAG TPA: TVP38/TMEM64 family protein [Myxococcota bacterium]
MADPSTRAPVRNPGQATQLLKLALGAVALFALLALGRRVGSAIPEFNAWVDQLGPWGPAVFMTAYAASVVAFVPASLLTLAAGAIFGIASGTLYTFVAATVGAALAFLVSRYVARGAIERKLAGNEKFRSIDSAIGEQGRKIVFLLRLSPIFPFNLLNYALGLTRVGFTDYVVASVGMLPATLLYVYSGKVAGDVAALAGGVELDRGPADYAVWILGLAATIVATALVTRTARRALAEATGAPSANAA